MVETSRERTFFLQGVFVNSQLWPLPRTWWSAFPGGSVGKESACSAGDPGSIPRLGRSPGGGHGNPLQYSCLENSMYRSDWAHAHTDGCVDSKGWRVVPAGGFQSWEPFISFLRRHETLEEKATLWATRICSGIAHHLSVPLPAGNHGKPSLANFCWPGRWISIRSGQDLNPLTTTHTSALPSACPVI